MSDPSHGARGRSRLGWVCAAALSLAPIRAGAGEPPSEASPTEVEASPTEVEASPTEVDARPGVLKLITSAASIVVRAVPVEVEGAGDPVALDLGQLPIAVELPAGRYRIELEGPGYVPWSREVELRPGEVLELQAEPELISGARLELRPTSEAGAGASVSLDGVDTCELPCSLELDPGAHQLEIRKRRNKSLSIPLDVSQADEIEIDVTLAPAVSRAPAIVTGAVALTSLAVAIAFTARSDRTRRSLAEDLQQLEQFDGQDRRIENGQRDAVIAASLYGVTAAVGILTLYYLLRQPGALSRADKRQRNLAGLRVAPSFGPTGVGLHGVLEF